MNLEWLELEAIKDLLYSKKWKILNDADIVEVLHVLAPKRQETKELSEKTHERLENTGSNLKEVLEAENYEFNLDKIKLNPDIDYIWFGNLNYMHQSVSKLIRIYEDGSWKTELINIDDLGDEYAEWFEMYIWRIKIFNQALNFVKEKGLWWFNKMALPFHYFEDGNHVYGLAWRDQSLDGRDGRCNNLKIRFTEETYLENKEELDYFLNNPKGFLDFLRDKFPKSIDEETGVYDIPETLEIDLKIDWTNFEGTWNKKIDNALRSFFKENVPLKWPLHLKEIVAKYS